MRNWCYSIVDPCNQWGTQKAHNKTGFFIIIIISDDNGVKREMYEKGEE